MKISRIIVCLIYTVMDLIAQAVYGSPMNHVIVSSNQSEAVLDSVIGFVANYSKSADSESNRSRFRWRWSNNADQSQKQSYTNHTYNVITKVFNSDHVNAGKYNMKVDIFNNSSPSHPKLATGYNKFYLTEHLNGNLKLHQQNLHQRKENYYSTKQPIFVTARVTDTFRYYTEFEYSWLLNSEKPFNTSTSPKHQYLFVKPVDRVFIGSNITAKLFNSTGQLVKEKHGRSDFTRFLNIRDSVEYFNVYATNTLLVNSSLNITVTCQGSPTFTILISMKKPNEEVVNRTILNLHQCYLSKSYVLEELGQYSFKVVILNDVSLDTKSFTVNTVVNVPPVNAVIPVICVLVFIIVLAVLAFSYHKDSRRVHIETANFDFRVWKLSRPRAESFNQHWKKLSGYCKNLVSHVNINTPNPDKNPDKGGANMLVSLQPMQTRKNYSSIELSSSYGANAI